MEILVQMSPISVHEKMERFCHQISCNHIDYAISLCIVHIPSQIPVTVFLVTSKSLIYPHQLLLYRLKTSVNWDSVRFEVIWFYDLNISIPLQHIQVFDLPSLELIHQSNKQKGEVNFQLRLWKCNIFHFLILQWFEQKLFRWNMLTFLIISLSPQIAGLKLKNANRTLIAQSSQLLLTQFPRIFHQSQKITGTMW